MLIYSFSKHLLGLAWDRPSAGLGEGWGEFSTCSCSEDSCSGSREREKSPQQRHTGWNTQRSPLGGPAPCGIPGPRGGRHCPLPPSQESSPAFTSPHTGCQRMLYLQIHPESDPFLINPFPTPAQGPHLHF